MTATDRERDSKMQRLKQVSATFDKIIYLFACLSICLLIFAWLSVCSEIVFRYFLNHPLVWVVEISEYVLLYITFLGGAWLLRNEGHVSIDFLATFLSPKNQALLSFITSLLGAISCLALFWYAGQSTWDHFSRNAYDLKYLKVPFVVILAPIPIGSFMLSIQFMKRAKGYLEKWRTARNELKES